MTKDKNQNWVNFKKIKNSVTMEMALEHYEILGQLQRSDSKLVGCCPIHKGSNPRQFSVDTDKNIFNCFGDCKSGGNVLFVGADGTDDMM